jgi:hypothetical protein
MRGRQLGAFWLAMFVTTVWLVKGEYMIAALFNCTFLIILAMPGKDDR